MEAKLFDRLVSSVKEMDGIVRGERAPSREFHVTPVQVREIRKATGLSQEKFAKVIHVAVGTLKNWEQGHRDPTGPARVLLQVIKHDPRYVIEALHLDVMRSKTDDGRAPSSKQIPKQVPKQVPKQAPKQARKQARKQPNKRDLYAELEAGFAALAASRVSEPKVPSRANQTAGLRTQAKKSAGSGKKRAST